MLPHVVYLKDSSVTNKRKRRIKATEKQASPSIKPESETLVETAPSGSEVSPAAGASTLNCECGLWLLFAPAAQGVGHHQLRDTAAGLGRVWQEGQDRQAGRQRDGAELGPLCLGKQGGVLCRAGAQRSPRASPEPLAPAGEPTEGKATSERGRTKFLHKVNREVAEVGEFGAGGCGQSCQTPWFCGTG